MSPPVDGAVLLTAWQYYLSAGLVLAALGVLLLAIGFLNK